MFNVEILKHKCEKALVAVIDVDNAATLLLLADLYQGSYLLENCKKFIKLNWNAVSETEDFQNIPPDVIRSIKSVKT